MINKQNLCLTAFAEGKNPMTPRGILISDNFTAATEGHILAFVNRPKEVTEDFPVSPDGTAAAPKQGRYIIRNDDAERLAKAIPKPKTMPILANAMPLLPASDSKRFLVGNLGSMQIMTLTPLEQKFPSLTRKLWPRTKPKIEISFSVELLEKVLSTMKKASTKYFPIVTLRLYAPDKAARFECNLTDEGQKMTGLIMPCQKS